MKQNFDIVSYCSGNYKDAYDFVIESWLKNSGCDNITIYTDDETFKSNNEKIKIVKMFNKNNDWLIGTGRRIDSVKHFISNSKCKQFVFLDIDCYVIRPFTEIFDIMENFYDVAVCRLNGRNHAAKETANAGVWMLKNNQNGFHFVNDWQQLAKIYRDKKKKGIEPHKVSFAQYSFTDVAVAGFDNLKPYKTLIISEKVYNSECSDEIDKWVQDIKRYNPSIIHFKKRKWREPVVVKKVFELIK